MFNAMYGIILAVNSRVKHHTAIVSQRTIEPNKLFICNPNNFPRISFKIESDGGSPENSRSVYVKIHTFKNKC